MADFRCVKFKASHLDRIDPQSQQIGEMSDALDADLVSVGIAYTVTRDNAPVAAFGLQKMWPGRASSWGFVSSKIGRSGLLYATREIVGKLNMIQSSQDYRRVEASTAAGFDRAARWAEALGFQREGLMRAYGPDGSDYHLWSRVR